MCGILGLINPKQVDEPRFGRALTLLSHRGPDHSGVENLGRVILGHTRLSVQDLSHAGDQPMIDPSGRVRIVFNGEIYNFKELRSELERLGCRFRSQTDTEVIIQGYLTWGWPQVLERLQGDFAFSIYDVELQRILIVRDHIGKKPLFYSQQGSQLIFSSEIKAIISYIGPRPLDRYTALNPMLMTGLSPMGTTMFQGIQEVEPGCFLEYDLKSESVQSHRYFHVTDLVSKETYEEIAGTSSRDLIRKYCEELRDSVSHHLISDARLGVMFSAGVDSSLIAAVAQEVGDQEHALFHFISELSDTSTVATEFEQKIGGNLKMIRFNESDVIYDMPRMIYNYETINKEEGTVLSKVCKAAREDGYKVLLTGDGADELFGGFVPHKSFYTRTKINNSRLFTLMLRFLRRALPGIEHAGDVPKGTDYFMFPSGLNFMEVPLNVLFHKGSRLGEWKKCLEAYDFLSDPTERETSAYLLDDLNYRIQRYLVRSDRMGMMESVELRSPYLYMSLVKMAVNTPLKWRVGTNPLSRRPDFLSPFNEKRMVKEMAKAYSLPKSIVYRRKIGTLFDGYKQVRTLAEKFPLKNVADFFELSENRIRENLLDSFDPEVARIQWSLLASEVLMREFVQGEDHEKISEEFRAILHGQ